jgi:hypothetical protein
MSPGGEVVEFVLGEFVGNIIKDFIAVFFPGAVSTAYGIYDFISTVFDFFGTINRIIDYINYCNSLPGVILGVLQLCLVSAIPVLILVLLFNVIVRLVRRFLKA